MCASHTRDTPGAKNNTWPINTPLLQGNSSIMLQELWRPSRESCPAQAAAIESSRGRSDKAWKGSLSLSPSLSASPKIYTGATSKERGRWKSSRFPVLRTWSASVAGESRQWNTVETYIVCGAPFPREATSSRRSRGDRIHRGPGSRLKGPKLSDESRRDLTSDLLGRLEHKLVNFGRLRRFCEYIYIYIYLAEWCKLKAEK